MNNRSRANIRTTEEMAMMAQHGNGNDAIIQHWYQYQHRRDSDDPGVRVSVVQMH